MEKDEMLKLWNDRVGAFAAAVGVALEKINNALALLVGEPSEEALSLLGNPEVVPDQDIKDVLKDLKIPSGILKLHLSKLRPAVDIKEETKFSSTVGQTLSILPSVPDAVSFMEMLRTGGVAKVGEVDIISAVKAALASKVNLFNLPEKFLKLMESHALQIEEPFNDTFYKVQKLLTQKKYGDILSIIGVDGSYVSEARKKEFFIRIDNYLWNSLQSFHIRLNNWQQSWVGSINPSLMMMAIAGAGQNGPNNMPPMAAPDTSVLRSEAETFADVINKIFAGPGIPVARALAYDATRIMSILEDSTMPAQIGATTKEEMLKKLDVNVGSDMVRAESNICRYVLGIISLPKVPADSEIPYISAMLQLGSGIPWEKLGIRTGQTL